MSDPPIKEAAADLPEVQPSSDTGRPCKDCLCIYCGRPPSDLTEPWFSVLDDQTTPFETCMRCHPGADSTRH